MCAKVLVNRMEEVAEEAFPKPLFIYAPLATAPRFQMGMAWAHHGFHPFRGFHPRLWSFAPTALLHGAQRRFSVTGEFWGDVSEETDYIFTKCRLVYIINFVDLWSK